MGLANQEIQELDQRSEEKKKSPIIKNPKERKRVKIAIYSAILLVIAGFILTPTVILHYIPLHTDNFVVFHQYVGSVSRVGFLFAVAIYPIFLLLKNKKISKLEYKKIYVKKLLGFLAKITRQWHVPVAILAMGFVIIHAYLAILNGFKWDGGYISGILALVVLGILAVSGIFRYRKLDKKWHLILGLLFVTLFIVHTLFSPTVG
jgi:MFS family permease